MDRVATVSIVIPIHAMKGGSQFLWRSINALTEQTFKDWELIITKDGKMAENTNSGIKRARGKYIKILYLDDILAKPTALEEMVNALESHHRDWLICGVNNNQVPYWTDNIETGNNKLGSPSALIFKNRFEDNILFDNNLTWLLDVVLYRKLYDAYGLPLILPGEFVKIGVGPHQMTHIIPDEVKLNEHSYVARKYNEKNQTNTR